MKNKTKAIYITRFLRGFPDAFTVDELIRYLGYLNCKLSKVELQEILNDSQYLFKVDNNTFITRAGVFTDQYFSVCLTKEEVEAQCFLPGHRLLPFVDQDALSSTLSFYYKKKMLPKKVVTFTREFAYEHFSLYGMEYGSQYIANDPGMIDYDFVDNDCDLPAEVNLLCVDISDFFKKYSIKAGDRLLLKVANWDECVLTIEPLVRCEAVLEVTSEDILRSKWYNKFEKALLKTFDVFGPCGSIEEQLANVYFTNMSELSNSFCGSVEEFLLKTKKVDMEFFGVETRLWKKGEYVPVLGSWNKTDNSKKKNLQGMSYIIPDFILDEYIKNYLFIKKEDFSKLITEIFPSSCYISSEYRNSLLLHIAKRNAIILSEYNWFADYKIGKIREIALPLYTKVSKIAYEIDQAGDKVKKYPQQELIVLIQLYTHITKLLETIAFDPEQILNDVDTIMMSLEGMNLNFYDILPKLNETIFKLKQENLILIKN